MKRKNIVFVLNEYNGHGGAQRVAAILANEFVSDNHNVSVLSINEQVGQQSYFSEDIPITVLYKDGYRAPQPKELYTNLKSGRIRTVRRELKRRKEVSKGQKEVMRFFDRYGDELVYVIVIQVWGMQWLEPLIYRPNVKIIGQSHESYNASRNSQRYNRILKYYRQIPKFLLLTEKDALAFKNDGFTNVGFMYNPTTFKKYNNPHDLYRNKTIVSIGRLVDDKGFDIVIRAFALVSNEIPGWRLDIYGDGPAKKTLQTLIDVLNLNEKVHLKGNTNKTIEVLSSSSFFVLGSRAEGLPMTLIEAQSCGLPCISTDCAPGIREVISEYENGLITPVDDVNLMARHIRRLANNQDLFYQYSSKSYESSQRFDKTNISNQWYQLFDELEDYNNEC